MRVISLTEEQKAALEKIDKELEDAREQLEKAKVHVTIAQEKLIELQKKWYSARLEVLGAKDGRVVMSDCGRYVIDTSEGI